MDKRANRDKRKKNLSYKPKRDKDKEPEKETSFKFEETSHKFEEVLHITEDILPNNWTKYEIKDNDVPEGADFETLLQEPICNNSYFKFKSEQNWDADINSKLELNKYFTLDLKLLSEGISTIPFPKRHNLDENLFTHLELESIKKHSEIHSQKYKKFLEKKFPTKNINIIYKNLDAIDSKSISALNIETTELNIKAKELEVDTNDSKTQKNKLKSGTNDFHIETTEENQNINIIYKNLHELGSKSISEHSEGRTETTELNIKPKKLKVETNNLSIETTEENQNISKVIPVGIKIEPKSQRERKKHEDDVDELLNLKISEKNIVIDEPEIKAEDPLLQPTELQKVVIRQEITNLEQWLDDILDD